MASWSCQNEKSKSTNNQRTRSPYSGIGASMIETSTRNNFYVYEHTRNDTGAVFYVGKGTRYRCSTKSSRNRHWNNIVNKANGFKFYKIADNLDEEFATLVEIERIDQLKKLGIKLANITDGGDASNVGFKASKETRELLRKCRLGKPSPLKGKKMPKEFGEKISMAKKGKPGHPQNPAWHEKMKSVHVGSKRSEQTKINISQSKRGKPVLFMWVTNGTDNKKILKTSVIDSGWFKGRTVKKTTDGKFT